MKETYYTIKDVSMKTGMSPSTLRYYDKEGLLYFVKRNNAGIRMFKEEDFENLAKEKNITPAQVALGWLLAQKLWIVQILGSKKISRIEENIGSMDVVFTEDELKKIREDINHIQLVGARYPKEQEILVGR